MISSSSAEIVDIPDPNLEAALREALGIPPPTPLTDDDLATLTELDASGRGIIDLTGLECCANLEELWLGDNQITDISSLAELVSLQWLLLSDNQIADISPLAGLTNLQTLLSLRNRIMDIAPLAALINLEELHLDHNQIMDISPLVGLVSLRSLSLYNNRVADISPLAGLVDLGWLKLSYNHITDISPLAGLIALHRLYLGVNQIGDIAPLAGLINLTNLNLRENRINDLQSLVDNPGLGAQDWVSVKGNSLNYKSINTDIPILQGRGVYVEFDDRIPTAPIIKASGDGQVGKSGSILPEPLVVEVRDQDGVPFEGVPVTFTVTAGGGSLSNVDDATGADGRASATLTLGRRPGTNTVQVSAADIAEAVEFNATAQSRCPVTVISSDPAVHEDVYEFRDSVLASSEAGQWLIYLYYQYSAEVVDILTDHPMLAVRSAAILSDIVPGIRFLLNNHRGRDIVMTSLRVARIDGLFNDIGAQGSDDLAATLAELSEMLDDLKGMRISVIWESLE